MDGMESPIPYIAFPDNKNLAVSGPHAVAERSKLLSISRKVCYGRNSGFVKPEGFRLAHRRNSKRVLKNKLFIRLFKNVQMQGAQAPRNEAYMNVR